jgi:cold-inducible RNA-binding protein
MQIFCGNLPYTTTEDDLRELFSQFGTLDRAEIIVDHAGKSRGFGFVDMSEGGDRAIHALSGQQFQGRRITVNQARPRPRGQRHQRECVEGINP